MGKYSNGKSEMPISLVRNKCEVIGPIFIITQEKSKFMTLWGGLIQITDITDIHQQQQQQQEADDHHDDEALKAIDAKQMTADDSSHCY